MNGTTKTKIDIFSGFLGAGKTTLIKKLIAEAYDKEKIVLIENEFGEIGVDSEFLKEAGIKTTEMNSGCICCSLVGDFSRALEKVIDEYAPERILIEPSGVGKLSDVIRAVESVDSDRLLLNSTVAVVDAKKCRMYMKNFGEFFNNQVEHAECIILSHTKGLPADKLSACVEAIRAKNEHAALVTTEWDELTGAQILEAMEKKATLETELHDLKEEAHYHEHEHHHHHEHDHEHGADCECECHEHHYDHEHHHEHHHDHHADEVFVSWGCETARVYTDAEMNEILTALENEAEYGTVLRAKGIVSGGDHWIHFDYVPETPDVRSGASSVTGRICVIGSGLKEENLEKLFLLL